MQFANLVLMISILSPSVQSAQAPQSEVSYEAFMRTDAQQREKLFVRLGAANRAALKRRHATDWLTRRRASLTSSQIAVIEEAIAFISPELYANPDDPVLRSREDILKRKLACSLGRQLASEAFSVTGTSRIEQPGIGALVDSWLSWFSDCVLRLR